MFVLSVYINTVYKEIRLPVINDSDYSVMLYRETFGISSDVKLELEVINGAWSIKESNRYYVLKDGRRHADYALVNNDMFHLYTEDKDTLAVIVREVLYPVAVFDKYDLRYCTQITVGKREDNDICYDFLGLVSREHLVFYNSNSKWCISNRGQNGVYVNENQIQEDYVLQFGDCIRVIGLNFMYLGDILAVDTSQGNVAVNTNVLVPYQREETPVAEEELLFKDSRILLHRAPRNIIKIERDPIDIESPPEKESEEKTQSLLAKILPSFTMAIPMLICSFLMIYSSKKNGGSARGPMMYMGLIMALSSVVMTIINTLLGSGKQGKEVKEKNLKRFDTYSKYLLEKTEEIKTKYSNNMYALNTMYKSAEDCTTYDVDSGLLWNRNARHADFLSFRVGIGNVPFQAPIVVQKQSFSMDEDSLKQKPEMLRKNFEMLYDVPIRVDLMTHKLVGLIGGERLKGAIDIIKLLATQIAANTCYTDVKMVFVYDREAYNYEDTWQFAKWFPHVWSEDKKVRYMASDKREMSDIFYELVKVFRQRDEESNGMDESVPRPYYIMFLMNPELIEGELISKYVYSADPRYGLSTVIVADSYANIPNECDYIVENDDIFQGKYAVSEEKEALVPIQFDSISDEALDRFARRLSNIYVTETGTGGDIPSSITFFDMYGVKSLKELNVLDRWRKNRTYENIKGLLGQKAGGASSYLDVHEKYHGPHGLVAGTTGSGKSETLQTYMLSLAVNYSPDDIGFFIIDYKGGGMANLFNGLPHMIGQISNLSGNQVRRAMVSIKSENRRRQRIFNENGVNNINLYTKLYKNNEATLPVPHLFIIIDEFAELKREEPDFMRELISVAQVGRSLGVHLILATQKPSGTVDDNIWSNSKFRLCLRVADKQDSNDMLHKPDAAYITQSGRCYLQVGSDEVYELFQSGYSGATYNEDDAGAVDIANLVSLTGRVELNGNYAKTEQKERAKYKWYTQIAEVMATALQNTGVSYEDCVNVSVKRQLVTENMCVVFEQKAIDYPNSTYNLARLNDYIDLYAEAAQYEGDVIQNLMYFANQRKVKLPQDKEKTQLDAVKDYLAVVAKENGYTHELRLWMPVLPTHLYLDSFEEFRQVKYDGTTWPQPDEAWSIDVIVGKFDDPHNQAQMPLRLNFSENGHHAVCGMVVSGKSTSLQTITYALINKYSPSYINIYALDFSAKMMSAFEKAPHVGGVMYEGDDEKIAKFFMMINQILAERKKLFRGGNYSQYVQVNGVKLPMILIVIDNVNAFNEKTSEQYLQDLITLSKEGVSHGIYLLLTAAGFGSSGIPNRIAENIKTVITTEMADKFAYAEVTRATGLDVIPEAGVKGRGLAMYGKRALEYQTALAFETADDYSRLDRIGTMCEEMALAWTGRKARPVPEIPEKPVWSEFSQLEEFDKNIEDKDMIPAGYDSVNATICSVDLRQMFCYLITGFARSGKKNFLRVLIQSALKKDAQICVIDNEAGMMKIYEEEEKVTYINTEETLFQYFMDITPEFKRRVAMKRELLAQDLEESEIYEKMSGEQPIFIFISDMAWFMKQIYTGEHKMGGFMENMLDRGRLHNIYFFGVSGIEGSQEYDYQKAFKLFVRDKVGIHFGGNVAGNRIFSFDGIPYKEQSKVLKAGLGMTANAMGVAGNTIVVPLARR
ncbi:MAG: type VII secretion protein EssC [Eubacteriales bacterium]|nr:type VII secretion protein EssC [Eubacteriales bacterium]